MGDQEDKTDKEPVKTSLWEDDTVEYCIYCEIDICLLSRRALECNEFIRQLSGGHMWHYAPFFVAPTRLAESPCSHLIGRTCFRDNIQDEWYIVYLLLRLSKKFSDLVISVEDGDGQFLLIEAAHFLEKWMHPEEMRNRVFIHEGCVHIIPKPRSHAEIGILPVATPTIEQAVSLVRNKSINTRAKEDIQTSIKARLSCFDGADPKSLLHRAHCVVPSLVGHVISQNNNQLVSAACHALHNRTPADMHICRKMETFSPKKYASVKCGVYFSRFLYAQLVHLVFSAPRGAGFRMPHSGEKDFRECDLGMKLSCGLEMLLQRAHCRAGGGEELRCAEDSPKWLSFLDTLKSQGYFECELEGSRRYQEKVESAKEYFLRQFQHENDVEHDPLLKAGREISRILREQTFLEEEMRSQEEHLQPQDDDSWMTVSEGELDAMMHKRLAKPKPSSSGHVTTGSAPSEATSADLQSMVFGMKSFVEKVSSHSGAEFPWDDNDPANTTAVDFDADTFLDAFSSLLKRDTKTLQEDTDSTEGDTDEDILSTDNDDEGEGEVSASGGVAVLREEMEEVMALMDKELAGTSLGKSFERRDCDEDEDEGDDGDGGDGAPESDTTTAASGPVDVDFNLVKNLLDSYSSQEGGAGPASNILYTLGIDIPKKDKHHDNNNHGNEHPSDY